MNQEIKRKWLEDLRSGEYKQGIGCLCIEASEQDTEDEWCCLGVLTDQYAKAHSISWERAPGAASRVMWILAEYALLPTAVMEWAELDSSNPMILGVGELNPFQYGQDKIIIPNYLVDANDSLKLTFSQIADLIEWAF